MTTPLGFITGNGRSSNASAKLKMAELAPMPMASEQTATAVNAGFFASILTAYFTSFSTGIPRALLGNVEATQQESIINGLECKAALGLFGSGTAE